MSSRSFVLCLGLLCGLFLIFFFSLSFEMEKYSGSNSRLGGFLESEYGWNQSQTYFESENISKEPSLEGYVNPVDLLVIGDSFSGINTSWLYFVREKRKVSTLFLHIDRINIQDLLAHEIFLREPPKYLFIQSTEGMAFLRYRRINKYLNNVESKSIDANSNYATASTFLASNIRAYKKTREKDLSFEERMAVTGDYLIKSFQRNILGAMSMEAQEIPIDCETCFSNSKNDFFLVKTSSLDPKVYKVGYRDEAISALQKLKGIVESNGYTRFFSSIFPSKINVYLPYTPFKSNPTAISSSLNELNIGFIDLLPALRLAIEEGETDVYLPNDHHMGTAGFRVAAMLIDQEMFGND